MVFVVYERWLFARVFNCSICLGCWENLGEFDRVTYEGWLQKFLFFTCNWLHSIKVIIQYYMEFYYYKCLYMYYFLCFRSSHACHKEPFSMTTIYYFCLLLGLVDDSIHLFLGSTLFVLKQVFVTSSDSPVVWCGHTRTFWPTAWWLEVLPIPSTGPVSISMISC